MKKAINILLVMIVLIPTFCIPSIVQALTLSEFEKQVEDYTADLTAKQNQIAKNDEEVSKIKTKIQGIENQITIAKSNINQLEKDIEALNNKIATKKQEVKKIINFIQISNGESTYLEYVFGAKSFTDLIYRVAVAEQMSSYNERLVGEYNKLIEQSKSKQEELKTQTEELTKLQEELAAQKSSIEADTAIIRGSMPSVEERIREAKKNVEYYKGLGCRKNEDVQACQYRISQSNKSYSIPAVAGFYKPTDQGKVSQAYKGLSHLGYDIVSTTSNKSIPVHPIAQGQVFLIYSDNCTSSNFCSKLRLTCNGNAKIVVVRHNTGKGYIYSSYVHLSSYGPISEGQLVYPSTILGYMGNTGCSTASHLHLEITSCHWKSSPTLGAGGCSSYGKYERSSINPANYIGIPNSTGYRW